MVSRLNGGGGVEAAGDSCADAVIAGRAAPGTKITLLDDGKPVGSAEADDRGEWVLLPDSAVDPGQHKFSVRATDDKGTSQDSEKEVIVVVPKPAEDIAGQPVTKPSGAFYIFPEAPGGDGDAFVRRAIDNNVLIIPSSVFSARNTHIRISFAASNDTIKRGVEVLNRLAAA